MPINWHSGAALDFLTVVSYFPSLHTSIFVPMILQKINQVTTRIVIKKQLVLGYCYLVFL